MIADSKAFFAGLRRLAIGGLLAWPAIMSAQSSSQLSITTGSPLPTGAIGAPYSQTIAATGGVTPYRWAGSGSLPAGLQLDPATGALSGTPSTAGTFSFPLQVTDASNAATTRIFA